MAWFIGQSAVMIVLAFLLGLLVGWLIWGRRLRALSIEVRALRESVAACEANHGVDAATVTANDGAPIDAALAASSGTTNGSTANDGANSSSANGKPASGKAANIKAPSTKAPNTKAAAAKTSGKSNGKATTAKAPKATNARADSALSAASGGVDAPSDGLATGASEGNGTATPIHIPAPRSEMADIPAVETHPTDDAALAAGSVGVDAAETATNGRPTDDAVAVAATTSNSATGNDEPIDDLVRIEGIGPKIAAALITAGIRTFRHLADADESTAHQGHQRRRYHLRAQSRHLVRSGTPARRRRRGGFPRTHRAPDRGPRGDHEGRGDAERNRRRRNRTGDAARRPRPDRGDRTEDRGRPDQGRHPDVPPDGRRRRDRAHQRDHAMPASPSRRASYTWSDQARLLADGDEDGFAVLTARLIAGRRPDDDLERIEGIGPPMAAALHSAGIRTYRALADSSDVRLRNAVTGSGLSFAPSIVTWSRQARLLADGDEDGFADLTRRLIAGRDEGRA